MKRILLIGSLVFLIGCAEKPMATSVVDLAGNIKVAGWKGYIPPKHKQIFSPSKKEYPKDSDNDGIVDYLDRCPNTPIGVEVNHYGCPIITTLRLNFDFNKAKIKKIYYSKLAQVAETLKANPNLKIEIDGYTDNIGSAKYNLELSQKRAQAVKDILVKKYHINPSRIIVKGYGEAYPLVPNTTASNRALNRRVEIVGLGKGINSTYLNTNLNKIIH